ncbi:hypothetical protein VOLCADRAFT_118680 [Volvox carteri f. nagariensis]|uniref:Uncharacterized protein n=1 Tax=Volvox carteri f. nagariensis TaxID=3068 RepID=D8U6L8_VOLCA|nr:uncharacterized protein VOLCADRAFT_118680 [Volvox carteri f. nagariensis]EFJ44738.1 hypothetical protein VOLCADRAFT_118680 [Volvox carteri f. nagariensis]|eukprot:XP_002954314.1 hypothetical protein VOLCADRAFT_118680 [Volvox carteri f. nagariensis]
MPFFKRIFGQGKSKARSFILLVKVTCDKSLSDNSYTFPQAPNTLVALCIGDYSRITLAIEGKEAHQLQALLAHEVTPDEGSPSTSQVGHSVTKSSGPVSQTSFRALRHLLQHFGSGAGSTLPQDNAEVDAQRQFSHFIKNLGGYPSVSFLTAGEDGLITRDRVLAKLTKLFKHSNAPVVLVSYCGPSDERGNWRLATGQIPGASAGSISGTSGGGGGGGAPAGGGGGGVSGASGTCVLSFRELSTLWQRYRKHSQRLVLLLDCANSGYWVSALRMLSKAEQLELSLGVQASDCSLPDTQSMQLTYQPGIFVQFYLVNNKWRREQRRNVSGNSQHPQSAQHGPPSTTTTTNGAANSSTAAGNGRVEVWLPGMVPSYYATWLNDNLVDYGIALKFFNMQVNTTAAAAATACGGGEGQGSSISQPLLRKSEASVNPPFPTSPPGGIAALYHHYHHYHHHNHNRNVRASTGPIAAFDSSKLLGAASSRLGDDLTSPSSDPWASPRSGGTGAGSGTATGTGAAAAAAGSGTGKGTGVLGADQDIPEHGSLPERAVLRSAMALRAVSMQESARQRFSALFHDNCTADGAGSSPLAMPQGGLAGSPQTPTMHRVRLSTPQAEWYNSHIHSPPPFLGRSPTLPGEDSLYKMGHEMEGINNAFLRAGSHLASSSVMSPCGSGLVDLGHSGHTSGLAAAAATANGSSRLQCRSSGAVADTNTSGSQTFPSAPSRPAPELPLPYAPFHGPAVHHAVLDTTDDAGSSLLITTATAATATAAGDGCDEVLVVQPSAPSDSVAMAWDRRSSQAARHLADDRGGAAAASFTNPSMLERLPSGGGFANELFGALHEVATERRLRARRAPLGGDESLDTMMEDAELGSVASIPSFMLPRAQLPGGELSGSMGRVQPLPMDAATAANGPPSEPSAGGGGSSSISIPIRGSRGRGVSITSAAASITAAAQAQQRTSALLGLIPGASAGSISGTSGGGGGGGAPAGGGGGGVSGASGTCVLSFRELSTLWQRYRKHSQRLVLLLDCANSGYWVSALRMLSKAEQLELSLGVQVKYGTRRLAQEEKNRVANMVELAEASDCSLPDTQSMQLTYQPAANSSTAAGNGRVEVWLPGMVPSYYATWLNDNLVDYGIALKFFNMQVNTTAAAAATACGGGEGQGSSISQPLLRKSEASVNPPFPTSPPGGIAALYHHYHHYHHHNHNRNVRASTGPIAAFDSSKLLGAASSRLGDDLTSPSSDPWASPRSGGTGAGSGTATGTGAAAAAAGSGTGKGTGVLGADQDIPEHGSLPERAVLRSAMALRAVSMQESARQRFSALFHDNCTADGAGSSPLAMPQGGLAGSPQTPTMHRVRLSTPQAECSGAVADTNTSGSQTFPSAPSRPAPELPLPYAPFHGPAVHHAVLDTTDDAGSSLLITTATAATATAAGDGCDEVLVVQPSAPSDSVAMAWDRRSSQAARHLADDRGGAAAASFTNPSMLERLPSGGGFANELFGALHEVATERRLRARRAPLGGDESLDTMMEDAELGSVASIPSFMLPRAQLPGGELSGSMGRVQPLPMDAATAANGPPSEPSAGGGGSSSISIPIRGSRGRGVSITSAAASITAAAQAQQRTSALLGLVTPGEPMRGGEQVSSVSQRKHTSRLFLTSVASAFSGEQTSAGQMGELGDVADGSGGGAAAAAAATSDEADCLREAEASHDGDEVDDEVSLSFGDARRRALMEVDQGRRQEQYGKLAAAGAPSAVAKGTQDMRTSILGTQESSGLPVAAAPPAAPTSMEWPQPVDSLPPSQAMPWLPSGHGLRRYHLVSGAGGGSGAGGLNSGCGNIPSSSGARGLIRQYVSIADSMDLDSASLCVPWQRRPGRFEMAGSESSSFVFGDDQERFDMLRLLREQEQQPGQQPVRHAQQQAGAAFQRTGQSALATATTAAAAAAALEAAVEGGSSSAVSDDVSSARREDEVEVDGREMQGFQLADVLGTREWDTEYDVEFCDVPRRQEHHRVEDVKQSAKASLRTPRSLKKGYVSEHDYEKLRSYGREDRAPAEPVQTNHSEHILEAVKREGTRVHSLDPGFILDPFFPFLDPY